MISSEVLAHDLAIVALSQRLAVDFKGKALDEGQIYGLYQDCFKKIVDVIGNGGLD